MSETFNQNNNFIHKEIPGFDSIRGLAITLVILAHIGFGPANVYSLYPPGVLGVDMFMVLSGFLIVSVLLKDFEFSGRIRLRDFYLRRASRILPALFSVILTCLAISVFAPYLLNHNSVAMASLGVLTISLNQIMVYDCAYFHPLSHLWSLSLEEQFYLILPFVLILLLKARSSVLWIVVASLPILFSLFTRYPACWMQDSYDLCWNMKAAHGSASRFMGQGIGAILGCLWRFNLIDISSARCRNFAQASILCTLFYLIMINFIHTSSNCIGFDIICLGTVGLIIISLNAEGGIIKKLLLNSVLRYTGKISYGLYLWHSVLLWIAAVIFPNHRLLSACSAILFTFGLATASYYFLELPFLRRVKGVLR